MLSVAKRMQAPFRPARSGHYSSSSCFPIQARPSSPAACSSADEHEAENGGAISYEDGEEEGAVDQHRLQARRAHSCSKLLPSKLSFVPSFKSLLRRADSLSQLPHLHSQSCAPTLTATHSGQRAPRGHVAVYVEAGMERRVVPITYLSHPHFQALLERAEREYGLRPTGPGLRIPCSLSELHHTLNQIRSQV